MFFIISIFLLSINTFPSYIVYPSTLILFLKSEHFLEDTTYPSFFKQVKVLSSNCKQSSTLYPKIIISSAYAKTFSFYRWPIDLLTTLLKCFAIVFNPNYPTVLM